MRERISISFWTVGLTTLKTPPILSQMDATIFFENKKLLPVDLANEIKDGIRLGPDGSLWSYKNGVYSRDEFVIQRRVNRILQNLSSPQATSKVRHVLEPELQTLSHNLPEHTFINLENGMYDYESQILLPHSENYNSIVQLPIIYDEYATCPEFDEFLSKILHKNDIPLIWEMIAYLLIPGNPLQIALLFYGKGSNGKSTLLNVLEALIGRANTSNITLNQMNRIFEPAELLGKQMNAVGDLNVRYLKDTETFKKITGGDAITAQRKNGHPFTFTNWAVPVFATNELFRSSDLSDGYFRRWLMLSFPNRVSEESFSHSRESLITQRSLSGIFNKAIPHIIPLLKRKKFKESISSTILKAQFKRESDNVAIWLEDDETITRTSHHENHSISTRKQFAFEQYKSWALNTGVHPVTRTTFYRRLEILQYKFFKDSKDNVHKVYGLDFTKNDPLQTQKK